MRVSVCYYMCVCMHVCLHAYVCVCTRTSVYASVSECVYVQNVCVYDGDIISKPTAHNNQFLFHSNVQLVA